LKKIALTIDYEVYLGSITGDVKSCMIEPTRKLTAILANNGSKMTVFWDLLHYYMLLEYQEKFPELMNDALMIENQILALAAEGHDIQLHLHPHWLDAVYENNKWNFDYKRFKLQNLSEENNENDINTIAGCISISKKMLENLVCKVKPEYKVTTFRAGGYLIQPFSKLREILLKHDILIDTSVCPGLRNDNEMFSYNFLNYPRLTSYKFSQEPKVVEDAGIFTEVPVTTVRIPVHLNLYFTLLRNLKYRNLNKQVKGTGSGATTNIKQSLFEKLYKLLFKERIYQFTTDSNFKEIFLYMINQVEQNSTMILHPKLLNNHTLNLFENLIKKNKVKFNSIKQFLDHKKISV
jgi:hypothetical protein